MTYEPQTWIDLPNRTTPLSADRLTHVETQYGQSVGRALYGDVWADFANYADGQPAAYESGQAAEQITTTAMLTVDDGILTHTPVGGASAGYLQADVGSRVTHVGATIEFTASSTGSVVLVMASAAWVGSPSLTNTAAHFSITPTSWSYGTYVPIVGQTIHDSGTLSLALNTRHEIDIYFEGTKATIAFPDGTVIEVTNALIDTYAGNFVLWELFEVTGAALTTARIHRVRASGVDGVPASARELAQLAARTPRLYRASENTSTSHTVTTGITTVPLISCAFVWPQSGKVMVTLEIGLTLVGTDNIILWPVSTGGTGTSTSAQQSAMVGRIFTSWLVVGAAGVAGLADTFTFRALRVSGASTSNLQWGGAWGPAVVKVEPVT